MFERLLARFGYVSIETARNMSAQAFEDGKAQGADMDEDTLALALAEKLGVLDPIDKDYEKKIFEDLKGTDGLVAYLREAAARDKDRYFGAASSEEQLIIRGSFARTMFLKSRIMNAGDEPKTKKTKIDGVKYG